MSYLKFLGLPALLLVVSLAIFACTTEVVKEVEVIKEVKGDTVEVEVIKEVFVDKEGVTRTREVEVIKEVEVEVVKEVEVIK